MQNTNKPLSIALVQAFANDLSASWRNGCRYLPLFTATGQARLAIKSGEPDEAIRQNICKLSFKNKENLLIVQKLDEKSEQLSDYKLFWQMNEEVITVFSRSGHAGDVSMKDQNSQVVHIDLMDLDAPR